MRIVTRTDNQDIKEKPEFTEYTGVDSVYTEKIDDVLFHVIKFQDGSQIAFDISNTDIFVNCERA